MLEVGQIRTAPKENIPFTPRPSDVHRHQSTGLSLEETAGDTWGYLGIPDEVPFFSGCLPSMRWRYFVFDSFLVADQCCRPSLSLFGSDRWGSLADSQLPGSRRDAK